MGTPKERFAYLFPSTDSALISVRLRPDLSDDERGEAIDLFKRATGDERFALGGGGDYVVSGVPAVVDGLASALRSELLVLLAVAIALMAITLAVVFSPPLRLLPLGVALVASALTFGLLALLGGSLTMASVAVLPVLIGLAVDYAIQFQARFNEGRAEGMAPARAATAAAAVGGPVIGAACLATAAALRRWRSRRSRWCAPSVCCWSRASRSHSPSPPQPGSRRSRSLPGAASRRPRATGAPRAPSWGGAGAWPSGAWARPGSGRSRITIERPGRVLAVALALAVLGWVASARTEVVSDIRELAPASLRRCRT